MIDKAISKTRTAIRLLEAKSLRKHAFRLFREQGFAEDWDTNFATGNGAFAELDLLILHKVIMQKNPKKVLELGSGKSTIAITRWLHKLNGSHAVVSMDEYEKWGNLTTENLNRLSIEHNTEVIISERVDSSVGFFLGTKYKAIPKHNYDLIFIDGPDVSFKGSPTVSPTTAAL